MFPVYMVKIRFIPPFLLLSGICFSDVFSDYKTFFLLWRFSRKCIISKIQFFEILKSIG